MSEEIDKQIAIISILSGIPEVEIMRMPLLEYQKLAGFTNFLNYDLPKARGVLKKEYALAGYEIKPMTDVLRMTTAQYVDFQMLSKDADKRVPEILSIFLVPKGMKYNDGYDIKKIQEAIREDLSILDINEMLAFFLSKFVTLMRATLTYSEWIAKRMKNRDKRAEMMRTISQTKGLFKVNGDGLQMLMQYQKPADAHGMKYGK